MYCNFSEKFKLIPSQVSRKGCAHFLFIGNRVAKAPGLNLATSLSNSINNREALSSQHFVCFASQKKDLYYNAMTRGGCRASETSKMECFVITVNGLKPLTIITKRSILDVAAVLDPRLVAFGFSKLFLEYLVGYLSLISLKVLAKSLGFKLCLASYINQNK